MDHLARMRNDLKCLTRDATLIGVRNDMHHYGNVKRFDNKLCDNELYVFAMLKKYKCVPDVIREIISYLRLVASRMPFKLMIAEIASRNADLITIADKTRYTCNEGEFDFGPCLIAKLNYFPIVYYKYHMTVQFKGTEKLFNIIRGRICDDSDSGASLIRYDIIDKPNYKPNNLKTIGVYILVPINK